MKKEIWKPIEGYEGLYEISNLGRVKSLDRSHKTSRGVSKNIKGQLIKANNSRGYMAVNLSKNGKVKKGPIHRLVAVAFIQNPKKKPCVNHKDGIKENNFSTNLEWVTYSENMQHAHSSGLIKRGISEAVVLLVLADLKNGTPRKVLVKKYNLSKSSIDAIAAGTQIIAKRLLTL